MSDKPKAPVKLDEDYTPPEIFEFKAQDGKFAAINRPTAGPRSEKELPRGEHALQLYSFGTPNGNKVTILLEELNLKYGLEYDAYSINIMDQDQFTSGFCSVNPNSKIPALLHYAEDGKKPTRVFETSAIMIYLCDTFDKEHCFFPPIGHPIRAECLSWLLFVHGAAPFLGGGFGHFYSYAPKKYKYAIERFTIETKRQLDVLDRHLGGKSEGIGAGGPFFCGEQYTIADIACWAWYGQLVLGEFYDGAVKFLQVEKYTHLMNWAKCVKARKAVKRGKTVNKEMKERHSSSDFEQTI